MVGFLVAVNNTKHIRWATISQPFHLRTYFDSRHEHRLPPFVDLPIQSLDGGSAQYFKHRAMSPVDSSVWLLERRMRLSL
jgi:hypothetical protein